MAAWCKQVTESTWFNTFILAVIILSATIVGLQTDRDIVANYDDLLETADNVILGIFIVEIVMRLIACGNRPLDYFRDGWNVFDFLIVVLCLMPWGSKYFMVARLFRVMRSLRLLAKIRKLQTLINALLKCLPSIGYVSLLLTLVFYVYAVVGTFLFRDNDPVRFGTVGSSMLTLFEIATFEKWVDVMEHANFGTAPADYYPNVPIAATRQPETYLWWLPPAYFVTFIIFSTYIVLNLCIGIIVNSMEEAHTEDRIEQIAARERTKTGLTDVEHHLQVVEQQLQELQDAIRVLRRIHVEAAQKQAEAAQK